MSRFRMSSRDARALLLLVAGVGFFFGYRPVSAAYGDLKMEVESNRAALAQELNLLQNATRYPVVFQRADSTYRSVTPQLFMEQDDVLATVAVQQYVDNVARNTSVLITNARNQPAARGRSGVRALSVEIQAESDMEGILKFLDRLENGPRLLHVKGLGLRPGTSESGVPGNENVLKLNATVTGFGVDTAIARGLVAPPPQGRGRRGQ